MENTIVIQDRIFLFASAFFRVDNKEWVNNHELIYEDNEDEMVNRFNFKLEYYRIELVKILRIVLEVILGLYSKNFSGRRSTTEPEITPKRRDIHIGWALKLFDSATPRRIKNYNGFYSGRGGGSSNQPNEDNDIWTKLRNYLYAIFNVKTSDNQEQKYYPRRMYRGNSLD